MILGFYGCHDSGKTTIIEKLIPELKLKGYRVATLKNIPREFSIDTENTDTYRHKQAGSGLVVASSESEIAFILNERMNFNEIIEKIKSYNYDVILVEGFKQQGIPKVKVGEIETMENTVFEYDGSNFSGILDYIVKEVEVQRIYEKLPRLDCLFAGKWLN